jgi:hypothetical protein
LGAQPEYELPDLPRDLTSLADKALMILFSEFTSWLNYAAVRFAEAEVEEERAEASLKYAEATQLVAAAPKQGTVTTAKAAGVINPVVQTARDRALDAYALRKMTSVMFGNCERCVNLISRELSRRIGRDGPERRQQRWNP